MSSVRAPLYRPQYLRFSSLCDPRAMQQSWRGWVGVSPITKPGMGICECHNRCVGENWQALQLKMSVWYGQKVPPLGEHFVSPTTIASRMCESTKMECFVNLVQAPQPNTCEPCYQSNIKEKKEGEKRGS